MFEKGLGYFFSDSDEEDQWVCLFRLSVESKLRHKIHFLIFLGHTMLIFENFLPDEMLKSQCISHILWLHNSLPFLEARAFPQPFLLHS